MLSRCFPRGFFLCSDNPTRTHGNAGSVGTPPSPSRHQTTAASKHESNGENLHETSTRPLPQTTDFSLVTAPAAASASTSSLVDTEVIQAYPPGMVPVNHKNPSSNKKVATSTPTIAAAIKFEVPQAMLNMFNSSSICQRTRPDMPSTEHIDYPRAASWSSSTVTEIMRDKIGKQLFKCFLYDCFAEENLIFIERMEDLGKIKDPAEFRKELNSVLSAHEMNINISGVAKKKLHDFASGKTNDRKVLIQAVKEINKLLESDQFPRFRRSAMYLNFLEKLLPRSYAEKWQTSFDALLGNHVGRSHFRQYLVEIRAEEFLRFWEAVAEYRQANDKSHAMLNMARSIMQQFIADECVNEIFLPYALKQQLVHRITARDVDVKLFDEAVAHVEQTLKNDPYSRFLQSKNYKSLLQKLKR